MLRTFISGLFLILGIACVVYGGLRVYQQSETEPETVASAEAGDEAVAETEIVVTGARQRVQERAANAPEPVFDVASSRVSPLQETTSFQDRLYQVPVAYETPEVAAFGKPFNVTFAIDGTGDDSAADALPGQDANRVEAVAKISDRLKASLVGSAFEVELLSPEVQRLSLLTENVWRWRVTPQMEGEHMLVLELFALDGDEAVPVRTFSDTVTVSVSSFQRIMGVADTANPLFVLLGGIGSAIGGFFGFFRFFRKR